jgi:hypothetical protein
MINGFDVWNKSGQLERLPAILHGPDHLAAFMVALEPDPKLS